MIVVDTNIISYLYLPTKWTPHTERLLQREPDWAAPVLWKSELRSVLAFYVRKKVVSLEAAVAIQEEAESLLRDAEYDVSSIEVLSLAASSGCSAYDCEFVALARALDAELVTEDRQLIRSFPGTAVSLKQYLTGV